VRGPRVLLAAGVAGVPAAAAAALVTGGPAGRAAAPEPHRPPSPVESGELRVPMLVGMPVGRAQAVVSHSGLRFAAGPAFAGGHARVIAMRPQAGALVSPGAFVVVRVRPVKKPH
jgi:hypothetical protein